MKKKKKDSKGIVYSAPILRPKFSLFSLMDSTLKGFDVSDVSNNSANYSYGNATDEGIKGVYATNLSINDIHNNMAPFPPFAAEKESAKGVMDPEVLREEDNNDIQTLSFFDFDGTLVNSLEPEEGKIKYKEITGKDYPYEGWWGRKESLEPFDITVKDNVKAEYERRKGEPNSKTILLTNRIKDLSSIVKSILDKNSMTFDDYNFKVENSEKPARVREYLKLYPNVKQVNVYDDRDKEIEQFKQMKKELEEYGISVNVFKVKK